MVTKPLVIEHVNKEYSYKIYKRNINNISIKYRYTATIKNIRIKCKYTRSSIKLWISINDKDSYEERQMNISECQIDTSQCGQNICINFTIQ